MKLFVFLWVVIFTSQAKAFTNDSLISIAVQTEFVKPQDSNRILRAQHQAIRKVGIDYTDSIFYQLTPTLSVVTRPIGKDMRNVNVAIYSASMEVYQVTITQASPFVNCPFELVLGSDKVEKGMRLTLQLPSNLQPGSIFMEATFSSLNVPSTQISAQVAKWYL